MNGYPKVKAVKTLQDKRLLITFRNETRKVYDCMPLLEEEAFQPLSSDVLFRCVQVDPSGYGITWTEEIDLSESELWLHGVMVEPPTAERSRE
jgi:hypothetical protein